MKNAIEPDLIPNLQLVYFLGIFAKKSILIIIICNSENSFLIPKVYSNFLR